MLRTHWDELAADVRSAIEYRTGPVQTAHTAPAGRNSGIAAVITTRRGASFIKGLRTDDPRVVSQTREAAINPYVYPMSPALVWRAEVGGWNLLGFEAIQGRHADYTPGSPDVAKAAAAMRELGQLTCPAVPELKSAEQRWTAYYDNRVDAEQLCGDRLLHTDWSPDNVLINGTARLIDWAWPTRGAGWIDPACLIIRLIAAGHTPVAAENAVHDMPAWRSATSSAIDNFALALARMWMTIAAIEPNAFKLQMCAAASAWTKYRRVQHRVG